MKRNSLTNLFVCFAVVTALFLMSCGSGNDGAKRYKLAKDFYLVTFKKADGMKLADTATVNFFDSVAGVWQVGSTVSAPTKLGVPITVDWAIEFKAKKKDASFDNAADWEVTGSKLMDQYNGTMERFEEKMPTAQDIEVLSMSENVGQFGDRKIFVKVKNNAKRGASMIVVDADYTDADNQVVGTAHGFGGDLAAGDSTTIECILIGEVDGAASYSATVKSALFVP